MNDKNCVNSIDTTNGSSKKPKVVCGDRICYIYYINEGSALHDNDWQKFRTSWEYWNIRADNADSKDTDIIRAYHCYLFKMALKIIVNHTRCRDGYEAKSFEDNLHKAMKIHAKTVMSDSMCKPVYRVLTVISFISPGICTGCCRLIKWMIARFNVVIKRGV